MNRGEGGTFAVGVPGWALPTSSGLLLVMCFPPFRLGALPFVALVPLIVYVARLGESRASEAARAGFLTGLVAWGVLLHWIPVTLYPVTPLAPALYVFLVVALALFVAAFAWATWVLSHSTRIPLWVAAPVAWAGCEWLRAHLGPFSFPWLELGTGFWHEPILAGPAELVGVRGLSFWAVAVSGLCAGAILASRRARSRLAVGALILLSAPLVWSARRSRALTLEPLARVAVVQPNLGREARVGPGATAGALARLDSLAATLDTTVDLVVWPEAVLTEDPRTTPGLASRVGAIVNRFAAPVLFGAYLGGGESGSDEIIYNGALVWSPGEGAKDLIYRKRRLVPGVEAIPFISPNRPGMPNRFAAFARGTEPGLVAIPGLPELGVLICYESIFSQDGRAGARAGGEILVNLTNDAWFAGDGGSGITTAFSQHPAHLVLRAVEVRQSAVRAANTGLSFFVDPLGRVRSQPPAFSPAVVVDTVYGIAGSTLFVRAGDWLAGGCAAVLAVVLLLIGGSGSRPRVGGGGVWLTSPR